MVLYNVNFTFNKHTILPYVQLWMVRVPQSPVSNVQHPLVLSPVVGVGVFRGMVEGQVSHRTDEQERHCNENSSKSQSVQ